MNEPIICEKCKNKINIIHGTKISNTATIISLVTIIQCRVCGSIITRLSNPVEIKESIT